MIPLCAPSLRGSEWAYVKECLDTQWVSSAGRFVDRFEQECSRYVDSRFGVACSSGTAALTVALRIAGVRPGDEVIFPTVTFIAPINAGAQLGAVPVFMDCDEYYNIDPEKTIEFIEQHTLSRDDGAYNIRTGRRVAALVPVHVFGNAARLDDLVPLCRERRIHVVEDATESLGSVYTQGRFAGWYTGTVGDLGCFSFNGNKIITTGGGGMIVTDDEDYAHTARYLTTQAKDDPVYFVHNEIGYNFRLTNVQAAMGVAQLEQLSKFKEIKQRNYAAYAEAIAGISGLQLASVPPYADNNCWMYAVRIDSGRYGMNRDRLLERFRQHGIETRPLWYLNHLQRPYLECPSYRIDYAPKLLETTLNIPCSVGLTEEERTAVIEVLSH